MNSDESKQEIFRKRLLDFSLSVIQLVKLLPKNVENDIVTKQVIRSSTSIGANYSEAMFAHGKADFIHCMIICRKEASETLYWLELLLQLNPRIELTGDLINDNRTIMKIFISSVKTARNNLENKK